MRTCTFCAIGNQNNREIIWRGETLFAIYSWYPVSVGHTLLIPNRHILDFTRLSDTEWDEIKKGSEAIIELQNKTDFKKIYTEMIDIVKTTANTQFCKKQLASPWINTPPDGYNFGINDGKAAGRTVDHLHWHIIPRFTGDMADPRGGIRHVIPEMGNYSK